MKEAEVINYIVTNEEIVNLKTDDDQKNEALLNALRLQAVKAETSGRGNLCNKKADNGNRTRLSSLGS